jgi:hypothetical protein
MALKYIPEGERPADYGKTGAQPQDYFELPDGPTTPVSGGSPSDPFEDMRLIVCDFGRTRKDFDTQVSFLRKDPVSVTREQTFESIKYPEPPPPVTSAKMNQQFFVWRDGQAGRLSLDMPFGFKEL